MLASGKRVDERREQLRPGKKKKEKRLRESVQERRSRIGLEIERD